MNKAKYSDWDLIGVVVLWTLAGIALGMVILTGIQNSRAPRGAWELYQESIERTEKRYDEAYGLGGVE